MSNGHFTTHAAYVSFNGLRNTAAATLPKGVVCQVSCHDAVGSLQHPTHHCRQHCLYVLTSVLCRLKALPHRELTGEVSVKDKWTRVWAP